MKFLNINNLKEFGIFFFLILVAIIGLIVFSIYDSNKNHNLEKLNSILDNTYLKKTITEITKNLKPRYEYYEYTSKSGDTHQSIIDGLKIRKEEKTILLNTILSEKKLKILNINQKFNFKLDNLSDKKIIEFRIETGKKNEILFTKINEDNKFNSKIISKNFKKKIVYKETIIEDSLYKSAINLNISPNIILEFARLYGFQIDFQRDIWKKDSFQIIYEEFTNESGEVVDTGEIVFANLNLQDKDYQLYKYQHEKNKIDYFDENGKSIKKTLLGYLLLMEIGNIQF